MNTKNLISKSEILSGGRGRKELSCSFKSRGIMMEGDKVWAKDKKIEMKKEREWNG